MCAVRLHGQGHQCRKEVSRSVYLPFRTQVLYRPRQNDRHSVMFGTSLYGTAVAEWYSILFFQSTGRLPAKSVPVSFDHLHLFEAMLFHQLTPKSFNHFSTLCIHLVLGLLFLAPSGDMGSKKRILVIGAGMSGLTAIKACKKNILRLCVMKRVENLEDCGATTKVTVTDFHQS
ncbi:hypothetical protein TNCV_2278361 [Trichonephila clavipes]|uniref:Uncharacterized protein n=1 Tax=Trichonephila clavipes TaxID=2585209 RepID=A0A8X6UQE5_TRICX|nr:hypothetical protein TNCV_2278361 [Trichonephila clavipes]